MNQHDSNIRAPFDKPIQQVTNYVLNKKIESKLAYQTAYLCLLDTLACGFLALDHEQCRRLLGPIVPGADMQHGARVPGTAYQLDPVQAAFNIGTMIRWLDFNDTWLAAEWGHPSDNLGALLASCDYLNRCQNKKFTVHDLLTAMIKAHEIQGIFALENSFNKIGLDHVVLVKVASTALAAFLFGANTEQLNNALSLAWVDGQSLRTYRHAPNTGSRKSWAAGDATSRGVRLALLALTGEHGYPSVLSVKRWGFYDVYRKGEAFSLPRDFDSYVMENVLFKVSYPAEFHAQTAVEAAVALHPLIKNKLDEIERIDIETQRPAIDIISKVGPLYNYADRDHCLQYMIAVGLIFGNLTAEHYQDQTAQDPRIDQLREKMHVTENPDMTRDYYDLDKRAISNAIQITFKDGSKTEQLRIDYPIGHRVRREESLTLLKQKFENSINGHFETAQAQEIIDTCQQPERVQQFGVDKFIDLFVK